MSDTPIKDTEQDLQKQTTNSTQEKEDSVVDITTLTNEEKTNNNKINKIGNEIPVNEIKDNDTTNVDNDTTNVDNDNSYNDDDDVELSMNDDEEDAALREQSYFV